VPITPQEAKYQKEVEGLFFRFKLGESGKKQKKIQDHRTFNRSGANSHLPIGKGSRAKNLPKGVSRKVVRGGKTTAERPGLKGKVKVCSRRNLKGLQELLH